MQIIRTEIELSNPTNLALNPIKARCMVDSGASYLCIPSHIASQLGLKELQKREVKLADGNSSLVPLCGTY